MQFTMKKKSKTKNKHFIQIGNFIPYEHTGYNYIYYFTLKKKKIISITNNLPTSFYMRDDPYL